MSVFSCPQCGVNYNAQNKSRRPQFLALLVREHLTSPHRIFPRRKFQPLATSATGPHSKRFLAI